MSSLRTGLDGGGGMIEVRLADGDYSGPATQAYD
jgi:hypothetical protein